MLYKSDKHIIHMINRYCAKLDHQCDFTGLVLDRCRRGMLLILCCVIFNYTCILIAVNCLRNEVTLKYAFDFCLAICFNVLFHTSLLMFCTDRISLGRLRRIVNNVIRFGRWVRRIVNRIGRLIYDPHVSFGDPEQPDDFVCYNMGGEEGVRYDLYTHAPTGKMS